MSDPQGPGATVTQPGTQPPGEPTTPKAPGLPGEGSPSVAPEKAGKPRSLARDAWEDLRGNPIFWIALVMITIFVAMALFPGLFTTQDPNASNACRLELSRQKPGAAAWFGRDLQGCDIYTRTIFGARASILVGTFTTLVALLLGSAAGIIAGFYGRWIDTLVSRVVDVFFAIPLLLGAIIILFTFPNQPGTPQLWSIFKVALAIAVLSWTSTARLMRASVLQNKEADYVQAARGLGAGTGRIIFRHILPNSLTPVIVLSTISLGVYIGAEASLSYLGIGLTPPVISWGIAISDAQVYIRTAPHLIFFPALFLSLTVLAFIMLGDAVREALDPKLR